MALRKECTKCSVIKKMLDFASSRLDDKELLILDEAANNETNVTNLVCSISKKYGFSKTSIWYNLKKLKEANLIDFGCKETKGTTVKITILGSIFQENNGRCKKMSKQDKVIEVKIPIDSRSSNYGIGDVGHNSGEKIRYQTYKTSLNR